MCVLNFHRLAEIARIVGSGDHSSRDSRNKWLEGHAAIMAQAGEWDADAEGGDRVAGVLSTETGSRVTYGCEFGEVA